MFGSPCRLRAASSGLAALLCGVTAHAVQLSPPDLYRVCVLCKDSSDPLDLKAHPGFLRALAAQYKAHASTAGSPISPFQDALLKETLTPFMEQPTADEGGRGEGAERRTSPVKTSRGVAEMGEPTAEERLNAIWDILEDARGASDAKDTASDGEGATPESSSSYEVTSSTIQLIETHVVALEKQLRQLSPMDVNRLIKALAVANYSNYHHTSLLSRRGCEVAADLPLSEVCRMYFNLNKLNAHDSLQPLVHRINTHVTELGWLEVFLVAQALERQPNTSSASASLISHLATQGAVQLSHAHSPTYHRALLVALARYDLKHHQAIASLLNDLVNKSHAVQERELLPILQAICELRVGSPGSGLPVHPACLPALLRRAEEVVPSMNLRSIDVLMDVLSFLPADTNGVMAAVMTRLDADAGKLSVPQVDFTLRMLSSYPPAKGHVCVVSLAFAAALRAESMEAATVEGVVVSLGALQLFTDDFYTLTDVLQKQKGGFRSLQNFFTVVESHPRPKGTEVADERFLSLIQNGILGLAPVLNDHELVRCRELLQRYSMSNKDIQQRILARAKQLQRGGGGASGAGSWGGAKSRPTQQQLRGRPPLPAAAAGAGSSGGRRKKQHYDPMADLLE